MRSSTFLLVHHIFISYILEKPSNQSSTLFCLKFTLKAQEMVSLMFQISRFSRGACPQTPLDCRAFGTHKFTPSFTKSWIHYPSNPSDSVCCLKTGNSFSSAVKYHTCCEPPNNLAGILLPPSSLNEGRVWSKGLILYIGYGSPYSTVCTMNPVLFHLHTWDSPASVRYHKRLVLTPNVGVLECPKLTPENPAGLQ